MRLILQHDETTGDDPGTMAQHVETYRDASSVYRAWIEVNHLGPGNVCPGSGFVYPDRGGAPVAKVAYNGRVMSLPIRGPMPTQRTGDPL